MGITPDHFKSLSHEIDLVPLRLSVSLKTQSDFPMKACFQHRIKKNIIRGNYLLFIRQFRFFIKTAKISFSLDFLSLVIASLHLVLLTFSGILSAHHTIIIIIFPPRNIKIKIYNLHNLAILILFYLFILDFAYI